MAGPTKRTRGITARAKHADAPTRGATLIRSRRWSETFVFVLALASALISFKTVWQFPYLVMQHGGGAFILIYLLLALAVGAPLLIAEILVGRRSHVSPVTALREQGASVRGGKYWALAGWILVLGGFIVFSCLSVVAAWSAGYLVRSVSGVFDGLTADGIASIFAMFVKDPEKQLFWHLVFIAITTLIAGRGLRRGIELAVKWLGTALFVGVLALVAYAIVAGNLEDALVYIFTPEFAKLSPSAWFAALAHVFFGLSLGTGMAMMYGAYLPQDVSIPRAALTVVGLQALVGICLSVVIVAVLLGGAVAPTAGATLVFQALPLAFDHLPLGRWFAGVFFGLLVIVALLTAIALIEPAIAWVHERFRITRRRAALVVGFSGWLLGLAAIFSFNFWAFSFTFFGAEKTLGTFDVLQILTAQFMLPLGALAIAIFVGWLLPADVTRAELSLRSPCAFDAWWWLLRVLVPIALLVLVFNLYTLYA